MGSATSVTCTAVQKEFNQGQHFASAVTIISQANIGCIPLQKREAKLQQVPKDGKVVLPSVNFVHNEGGHNVEQLCYIFKLLGMTSNPNRWYNRRLGFEVTPYF